MKIWRMFRHARRQAKRSNHQHQIGAVITRSGTIKSKGFNQVRRASIGETYTNFRESLHAERHACMQMQRDEIRGCDIYIWREYKDGRPASARPCEHCRELLKDLGIRRAIYSQETFPFYVIERF